MVNKIYITGIAAAILLALGSCNKAEQYYQKLYNQPEVLVNYDPVYGVGDTMILTGRLNPQNNLTIKIGDAYADIFSATKIHAPDNNLVDTSTLIDKVKFVITKAMGIGTNRIIQVTSAGNVTTWPSIEIIESSSDGYLKGQLQLVKQADIPAGATILYCQNGTGDIYLWKSNKTVSVINQSGQSSIVFSASSSFTDKYGTFKISSFWAGGVDPAEQYIYFSALTTDNSSDNAANYLYRFCRYDIKNKVLTTLNRTLYSKVVTNKTLGAYTPFEGDMASVKLMGCQTVVPDSKGNVYLNIGNYAVARLNTNNSLQYLFKVLNSSDLPQIWNSQTNQYYFITDLNMLFPGVGINAVPRAWAVDEGIMYGIPTGGSIYFTQFDLINQAAIYTIPSKGTPIIYGSGKPYISGSFNILSGYYEINDTKEPGFFGYLPLPGQKVLILYYQAIENYPDNPYYSQYPTLGTRNFIEKAGKRYAPGKLVRNGFTMNKTDLMLNYDSTGMIYMTANSNTVIVKTQYK